MESSKRSVKDILLIFILNCLTKFTLIGTKPEWLKGLKNLIRRSLKRDLHKPWGKHNVKLKIQISCKSEHKLLHRGHFGIYIL